MKDEVVAGPLAGTDRRLLFEGETVSACLAGDIAAIVLGGERPFTIGQSFPEQLGDALGRVLAAEARALILAGTTSVFCAGADLRLAGRLREPAFGKRWLTEQHDAVGALVELELPTIAAVHAAAAGAGCNLALACDYVLAAEGARFSQAFIRIGLATDMGSLYLLPRRVGFRAARDLILSGREVAGEEALGLRLVDEVVPAASLWPRALELARARAAAPIGAYAAAKTGLAASAGMGLRDSMALEARIQLDVLQGAEFAEGSRAFLEKRPPRFKDV